MSQPTLRDVARAAGVHAATVSRALNPETRRLVNDDTARRVHDAAEQLGYRPNPIARSLKTAKSLTVGVVLPDLTNPLFPPIVRGIEDALGEAGYSALIVNTDNDPDRERSQITSLRDRHVDGLIVATARLHHPLLDTLHAEGVPLVLVNRRADDLDVPSVAPDDAAGIALAVRHLAELGHRRVLHLAGPLSTSTGVVRRRAFLAAAHEHGLDPDPALVRPCSRWSEGDGARALLEAAEEGVRFTAVVAGNDLLALGCYDVLPTLGRRCPEDVSVVGFNNMPFLDKLSPPLSSVAVPHAAIGVAAARMLLDVMADPGRPPRAVLLPVTLERRSSTAPVAR